MKMRFHLLRGLVVGAGAFAAAQGLWLVSRPSSLEHKDWVLEPNEGLLLAGVLIAAASGCLGFMNRVPGFWGGGEPWAMLAGICISSTILLFVLGPGNLWPLALVIACVVTLPMVVVGWVLGLVFHWVAYRLARPVKYAQDAREDDAE